MVVVGLAMLGIVGQTVSIENPGIRLELFLKEISKQTGTEFRCPLYLNNEILAASFQNQQIESVKKQIARVVHGTWEQKGSEWWLVQTSDQKKEEQAWNLAERKSILQAQIDSMLRLTPKSDWGPGDAEKYIAEVESSKKTNSERVWTPEQKRDLRFQAPEGRFICSIASLLKPEHFVYDGLKADFRTYSVHPLVNQLPLSINLAEPLRRLASDYEALKAVNQSSKLGLTPENVEIELDTGPIPFFVVHTYDRNWRFVNSPSSGAFVSYSLIAEGEAFKLSEKTQELFRLRKEILDASMDSGITKVQKSGAYRAVSEILSQAQTRDPLGLLQGPCWIDFAKSVGRPMIVNLEDDSDWRPKQFVPKESQSKMTIGMKRIDAEGWVLGMPQNPLYNRTWRLDRSVIERLHAMPRRSENQSIEASLRRQDLLCYASLYSQSIPNQIFLLDPENIDFAKGALGSLSNDDLAACLNGRQIPVDRLSERGKLYLAKRISEGGLNSLSSVAKQKGEVLSPSYCFPDGISGMSLSASAQSEVRFFFVDADARSALGLKEFAERVKEASQGAPDFYDLPFEIGRVNTLKISVHKADKRVDNHFSEQIKSPPAYTWKTLPEPIKRQVQQSGSGNY